MTRVLRLVLLVVAALGVAAPVLAVQDGQPAGESPADPASERAVVVVADVRGPLEQRALDFLTDAVRTPDADLVVLQLDNPGIGSGDPSELFEAIETSPIPVTAWVGSMGAEAYGGAAHLLSLSAYRGAAPNTRVGYLNQVIAGGPLSTDIATGVDPAAIGSAIEVDAPIAGLVDEVVPTIGQFIASLDERPLITATGEVQVDTATTTTADDGSAVLIPVAEVRFLKPTLVTRTLRLAMQPEATFFFLMSGLALVAFELYAAGVGISAAVAVLALFLGGFGVASLPMSWPALLAAVVGLILYTIDFQNARISWRSILGTVGLLYGGLFLTDASPQFTPLWWTVLLVVIGVAAFYLVAMTTVARSRFSTTTIGREYLVGRIGTADTTFDPMGIVDVDGARWRARATRAAGLVPGDIVEVLSVTGIMLEVAPADGQTPEQAAEQHAPATENPSDIRE